jgi:hypothetical protein
MGLHWVPSFDKRPQDLKAEPARDSNRHRSVHSVAGTRDHGEQSQRRNRKHRIGSASNGSLKN